MNRTCICFLDTCAFDSGDAIRGAALLTDSLTEPLEFRCTSEVRPTKLQKTLWGDRLIGHIATRLIGKPLLDALNNAPSLVVVRKPEFVELRSLIDLPLIQLLREEEGSKATANCDSGSKIEPFDRDGNGEPIWITVHRQFEADLEAARELLKDSFLAVPLFEPFERIETSLKIVHHQESGKGRS